MIEDKKEKDDIEEYKILDEREALLIQSKLLVQAFSKSNDTFLRSQRNSNIVALFSLLVALICVVFIVVCILL